MIGARLPPDFLERLQELEGQPFAGIHPNWRMVCYGAGESFPAHRDQSDMVKMKAMGGQADWHISSHTLLINLSDNASFEGGSTRFFPKGDYSESVDVFIPQGFALVFRQKGVLHCGAPVSAGEKMVAQAGLMRVLGPQEKNCPNIFRFGPGMDHLHHKKIFSRGQMPVSDAKGHAGGS